MSDIATEAERMNRVDAALRGWRTETVDRRTAWDAEQAVLEADMLARRKRFLTTTGAVTAVVAFSGLALFAVFGSGFGGLGSATAGSGTPVVPPSAPELASIGTGAVLAPDREEERVGPEDAGAGTDSAGEASSEPVAAASTLDLVGEVLTWRDHGQLWIQLDYRGSDVELAWLDGAGNEVLERTPCLYDVSPGVRRCYVGRTARRLAMAREDGAVAGTWSTQACQDGSCSTVARWDVE